MRNKQTDKYKGSAEAIPNYDRICPHKSEHLMCCVGDKDLNFFFFLLRERFKLLISTTSLQLSL